MKKSIVRTLVPGTAAHVAAHGKCQMQKGKNFSLPYGEFKNPREAYGMALIGVKNRFELLTSENGTFQKIGGEPYEGQYTIELWRGCTTSHFPPSVVLTEEKAMIPDGIVAQSMGGLYFSSLGDEFHTGYHWMKRVLDKDGNILWQNWNWSKEKEIELLKSILS